MKMKRDAKRGTTGIFEQKKAVLSHFPTRFEMENRFGCFFYIWQISLWLLWRHNRLTFADKATQISGSPFWDHVVKWWTFVNSFSENLKYNMREIVHLQAGQCGNQIGAKVSLEGAMLKVKF